MMTPGFAEISIEGADARAFLHAQLASDVRALAPGSWQFSCYCGVDGRVQALALLGCGDERSFRLLLPAELCAPVLARLQRFRLRSRCTLTPHAIVFADASAAAATRFRGCGIDWIVQRHATSLPMPEALWDAQLALGIPWLLAATSERWLPQMLALERLPAFSLRKGCYPGQEIIARTHYLGRSKRRLARVRAADADGQPLHGADLVDASGASVGAVLAVDRHGGGLAVLAESAVAGAALACGMATMVIEGDVIASLGDAALNSMAEADPAHGVSDSKVV